MRRRGCQHPLCTATLADRGLVALVVTGQRGLAVDAGEQVGALASGTARTLTGTDVTAKA